MKWILTSLEIKGVKGVLEQSGNFDLAKGKSIAVYAPNGSGKSGYADAVEYLFSLDGSVEHYGKGGEDSEHGGRHAIPHVLAEEKGIESKISTTLYDIDGRESMDITRRVDTQGELVPKELESIIKGAPAHRILRSQDLSHFVTGMDPREKYAELSKWLGLEQLEKIVTHLSMAGKRLSEANHSAEIEERLKDISNHTGGEVTTTGEELFAWCANQTAKYVQKGIQVKSVKDIEECIDLLNSEYESSTKSSAQSSQMSVAKANLENLLRDFLAESGQFASIVRHVTDLERVNTELRKLLTSAKDSVFQEVWQAAKNILDAQEIENCPTCFTPWSDTAAGSQANATVMITASLSSLNDLKDAQDLQKQLSGELLKSMKKLSEDLGRAEESAKVLAKEEQEKRLSEVLVDLDTLVESNPSPEDLVGKGKNLMEDAKKKITKDTLSKIQAITFKDVPTHVAEIHSLTSDLIAIKDSLNRINELNLLQNEYAKVQGKFSAISEAISNKISEVINNTIASLRSDMIATYQKIDTSGAVPNIHIEPDTEEKSLILRIDFHSSGRKPPSGYLSESRVNALGLALFVSSIKSFNKTFPFVFLDDIVSSYDADNRARIVDIIAEDLAGCQIFLTTHDDRFYGMLKARLEDKGWLFQRIKGWSLEHGPKRIDDLLKPDAIDKLIEEGDPRIAGNAVRQFMEEWLDKMCAKYGVHILHKRFQKEFDRTLFDFWGPFSNRIHEIKGGFEKRMKHPCLDRLKASGLLNYYSHSQANPYEWDAIGDVRYIWKEFRDFQTLFNCHSCKKVLEYGHDTSRLFCTCGGAIYPG